jgi:hypothetical protein
MSDRDTTDGGLSSGSNATGDGLTATTTDSGSPDQVISVTSQSWLDRLRDRLIGSLIGIVLVVAAVALLYWHERSEVMTLKSLDLAARLLWSRRPQPESVRRSRGSWCTSPARSPPRR